MTRGTRATTSGSSTSAGNRFAGKLLSVDLGFEGLEYASGRLVQPDFKWEFVNVMIETPARRDGEELVRRPGEAILPVNGNRDPLEGHPQVFAHGLKPFVLAAAHPGKNGVTREEVGPLFKSFRNLNTQLESAFH